MGIAYIILAVVMAFLATYSGVLKLRRDPRVVAGIHGVTGVPMHWFPILATLEIAGALGLLIGVVWAPLGLAAGIGLVLYFLGAIIAHVRVRDFTGISHPVLPLVLAIATVVTRILSLS
jgi:hypothetical protein